MWRVAVLVTAVCAQALGDSGEIYDVTTVYHVGNLSWSDGQPPITGVSGRIHVGPNARGLVLYDNKNRSHYIVPSSDAILPNITCDLERSNCPWTREGFDLKFNSEICPEGRIKCSTTDKCIPFEYVCDGGYDCGDSSDEVNCKERHGTYESRKTFRCRTGKILSSNELLCNYERDCPDGSDEEVCYEAEGQFVSPPTDPSVNQFCLLMEFSTPGYPLEILVRDAHGAEHSLYVINDVKAAFNVKHVNITLPDSISKPINIIVKKKHKGEFKMHLINTCGAVGSEDVQALPDTSVESASRNSYKAMLPVYTVDSDYIKSASAVPDANNSCRHGGVLTGAGSCACLPGFTGSSCQQRCGRGRFGQDCASVCSPRQSACSGLLLCTLLTGCHCAPGYHGPNCNETSLLYAGQPRLSSEEYGTITVSFDPLNYKPETKVPKLYQIQYRELRDDQWRIHLTKYFSNDNLNNSNCSEEIKGLQVGVAYEVRVLLFDDVLNKYDGDLVQSSDIVTKCYAPEEHNYQVVSASNESTITFSWTFTNQTEHWCPLRHIYEVLWKEDWRWRSQGVIRDSFTLTGFLPGYPVQFKVRALTSAGLAPYSKTVTASTLDKRDLRVGELRLVSGDSASVAVAWQPPLPHTHPHYSVTYKCVQQPACPPGCSAAPPEEVLTVDQPSASLSSLLPSAQYRVTVTPVDGLPSSVYVATTQALPTETPSLSARRPERTNTSLTVFWDQQPVCSSFLLGYNYQLHKESESLKVLDSGFTTDSSATFHNLTASTDYEVRVFVTTLAGWNPQAFLAISTSTSATVEP